MRQLTRITELLFVVLFCILAAEIAARAYWKLSYNIPVSDPGRIVYAIHPELRKVDKKVPRHDDEFYDILLLGGSVLNKHWGSVERSLKRKLRIEGHSNVRIFNLAIPAHTSRDSMLKYAALSKARFELVVFYHGINETRANNAPSEIFRRDYSHYSWYEVANSFASHQGTLFALPYTIHYLLIRLRQSLKKEEYVPTHSPRQDWVQYGSKPRSALSFEDNVSAIKDLAEQRGDQILLMTFAIYIPEDYSLEAFKAKRLDYDFDTAFPGTPIEIWGRPEHVSATVALQNKIVRRLAAPRNGVLFVDQANLMKRSARYFGDPCHLTVAGSSLFVDNMIEVLRPARTRGADGPV